MPELSSIFRRQSLKLARSIFFCTKCNLRTAQGQPFAGAYRLGYGRNLTIEEVTFGAGTKASAGTSKQPADARHAVSTESLPYALSPAQG